MSQAKRTLIVEAVLTFTAQGAVSKDCAVVSGTLDHTCTMPAGADPTSGVLGVALNDAVSGGPVDVVMIGATPVIANAAVAVGANVAIAAATGKIKTVSIGTGTNTMILGKALEVANGADEKICIWVNPQMFQG